MVFSSVVFLCLFLPIVTLLYYILPRKFRNLLLLIASLIFYGYGEPKYILLMIFSIVFNYIVGIELEKKKCKGLLIADISVNLLMLCFFKYTGNFIWGLALPIGISFYTFQTMSYTIDVYRGKVKALHNIIDFGMYICLFPQLIAGPIIRFADIEAQIKDRNESAEKLWSGFVRFVIGLGKKVVLANQIGTLWDSISGNPGGLNSANAWIGALAFTFQLYFDFSGYSDMAIGLGKMFGFDFTENFNYPYESTGVSEFWRRWHITLGSWFREYLYIPLGGNKKGNKRQIFNLLVVWALTGIWHGAGINFLFFGLYYFVFIVLEKMWLQKYMDKWPWFFRHAYALLLIVIGWAIFACDNTSLLVNYFPALFGFKGGADLTSVYYLRSYAIMFIVLILGSTHFPKKFVAMVGEKCNGGIRMAAQIIFVALVLLASFAFIVGDTFNPFLYFRF